MTPRLVLLLLTLVIVLLPWLLWRIAIVRRFMPLAVLQILTGVLLGPTGLGALAPELHRALFTPALLGQLSGLASLGVLLYVLVAGLHLDAGGLRDGLRQLAAPALGSIAVPFGLGLAAGWWMLQHVPGAIGATGNATAFIIGIAICTSVTALPVLAAMLREMELVGLRLGQAALAIAAINDAALWLMLAVLLALARGTAIDAAVTLAGSVLWLAAAFVLLRPWLARLGDRLRPEAMLVVVIVAALASAAIAEAIGIGYIIGAFATGVLVPPSSRAKLLAVIEPLSAAVLLPFFFVLTGLRAFIDPSCGVFLAVLIAATLATVIGKVAGTALPARATGMAWRDALALGSLMQTKGLMEVLVLAMLADAGLIGPAVFSALVAMAILCTVVAAPLTRLVLQVRARLPLAGRKA